MKAKEIRDLATAELNTELQSLKKELFNLRLQARTGQLENTSRIKIVKRIIARILTELNARANKVD